MARVKIKNRNGGLSPFKASPKQEMSLIPSLGISCSLLSLRYIIHHKSIVKNAELSQQFTELFMLRVR
jgi:hypothetical protein